MKKLKPINFSSKSIFVSLFTMIVLYILLTLLLAAFVQFTNLKFLPYIIVYTLFIVSIYILENKELNRMIKCFKVDLKNNYKKILLVSGSLILLEVILNGILIKIVGHNPENNEVIVEAMHSYNVILFLIYSVILCPTMEAILFFYPYNKVTNKKAAFILSSAVFALFHITASTNLMDLLFFIPYLSMSLAFAYGYFKTNNLFMSILIHSINNLLAFVLLLIL